MTAAEYKYLKAIFSLYNGETGVKLVEIAQVLNVSKVSVYRAMNRLENNKLILRDDKNKIRITNLGYEKIEVYTKFITFVEQHLVNKCDTPKDIALEDAINVVCSLSDVSLLGITKQMKCKCD